MKLGIAVLLLTVTCALVSCDQSDHDGDISIGVVLPLTGTISHPGASIRDGMLLAQSELSGSSLLSGMRLTLLIEDSESTVDGAEAAFTKLIGLNRAPAILGPTTSSATERIISLAQENSIVAFSPTSAAHGLSAKSEFVFRSSLTVEKIVPEGVRITKEQLGYTSVATIVNDADTFSKSSNDEIIEELGKLSDVRIATSQTFSRPSGIEAPDFTDLLNAIKDAKPTPEAIFLSALPVGRIGVITQANELGITGIPFIATLLSIDDVLRANELSKDSAEGAITFTVWIAASEAPLSTAFVSNYNERYREDPGDFAARGYAATHILAAAISRASSHDAASIRDALADIKDLDTIYGAFSFDSNGDAAYDPVIGQAKDGEFELFGQ